MLAFGQLAFLFNCRFLRTSSLTLDVLRGNRVVWWSALALVALQLFYTYVPFMNVLFESRPLPAASWIVPLAASLGIFLAVEALKALMRRAARRRAPGALGGGSEVRLPGWPRRRASPLHPERARPEPGGPS